MINLFIEAHLITTVPDYCYIKPPKTLSFRHLRTPLLFQNPTLPMPTSMAAKISRSIMALRSSSQSLLTLRSTPPLSSLSKRFLSSSLQQPRPVPVRFWPAIPLSSRLNQVRFRVNRAGNSGYSPLNSGSNFSDRPPTEMAPLFPGCDYEHWLIVMDKPGGEGATKHQMIDCYIQTLAKVVGR